MELLDEIIDTLVKSFDFELVAIINIATYGAIKAIEDIGNKVTSTKVKRIVMLVTSFLAGSLYWLCEWTTGRAMICSIILAPVAWSWIGKPILKKFGLDYKQYTSEDSDSDGHVTNADD